MSRGRGVCLRPAGCAWTMRQHAAVEGLRLGQPCIDGLAIDPNTLPAVIHRCRPHPAQPGPILSVIAASII